MTTEWLHWQLEESAERERVAGQAHRALETEMEAMHAENVMLDLRVRQLMAEVSPLIARVLPLLESASNTWSEQ